MGTNVQVGVDPIVINASGDEITVVENTPKVVSLESQQDIVYVKDQYEVRPFSDVSTRVFSVPSSVQSKLIDVDVLRSELESQAAGLDAFRIIQSGYNSKVDEHNTNIQTLNSINYEGIANYQANARIAEINYTTQTIAVDVNGNSVATFQDLYNSTVQLDNNYASITQDIQANVDNLGAALVSITELEASVQGIEASVVASSEISAGLFQIWYGPGIYGNGSFTPGSVGDLNYLAEPINGMIKFTEDRFDFDGNNSSADLDNYGGAGEPLLDVLQRWDYINGTWNASNTPAYSFKQAFVQHTEPVNALDKDGIAAPGIPLGYEDRFPTESKALENGNNRWVYISLDENVSSKYTEVGYEDVNKTWYPIESGSGRVWSLMSPELVKREIEWNGGSRSLLTAPDGSVTGWSYADGSGVESSFKIQADNFQIVSSTTPSYIPFSINGTDIKFNGNVSFLNTVDDVGDSVVNQTSGFLESKFLDVDTLTAEVINTGQLNIGQRVGSRFLGNFVSGNPDIHSVVEFNFDGSPDPIQAGDSYRNLNDDNIYVCTSASPTIIWVSTKGSQGEPGVEGLTVESVSAYMVVQDGDAAPDGPTGIAYVGGVIDFTGASDFWKEVPNSLDSDDILYESKRIVESSSTISKDFSTGSSWSTPLQVSAVSGIDGLDGSDGESLSKFTVYKISTTEPVKPIGGSYTSDLINSAPSGWVSELPISTSIGDDEILYSSSIIVFEKTDETGGFKNGSNSWENVVKVSANDGKFLIAESSSTVIVTTQSDIPRNPNEYNITITAKSQGLTGNYSLALKNEVGSQILTESNGTGVFTFSHTEIPTNSTVYATISRGSKDTTINVAKMVEGAAGEAGGLFAVYKNVLKTSPAPSTPPVGAVEKFYGHGSSSNVAPTGWTTTPSSPSSSYDSYYTNRQTLGSKELVDGGLGDNFAPNSSWIAPQKTTGPTGIQGVQGVQGDTGPTVDTKYYEYVYAQGTKTNDKLNKPNAPTNNGDFTYSASGFNVSSSVWFEDPFIPDEGNVLYICKIGLDKNGISGNTFSYSVSSISNVIQFNGTTRSLSVSQSSIIFNQESFNGDYLPSGGVTVEVSNLGVFSSSSSSGIYKWEYSTDGGETYSVLYSNASDSIPITHDLTFGGNPVFQENKSTAMRVSVASEVDADGQAVSVDKKTYATLSVLKNKRESPSRRGRQTITWNGITANEVVYLHHENIRDVEINIVGDLNLPSYSGLKDSAGGYFKIGDAIQYSGSESGTYTRIITKINNNDGSLGQVPSEADENNPTSLYLDGELALYVNGDALVDGSLTAGVIDVTEEFSFKKLRTIGGGSNNSYFQIDEDASTPFYFQCVAGSRVSQFKYVIGEGFQYSHNHSSDGFSVLGYSGDAGVRVSQADELLSYSNNFEYGFYVGNDNGTECTETAFYAKNPRNNGLEVSSPGSYGTHIHNIGSSWGHLVEASDNSVGNGRGYVSSNVQYSFVALNSSGYSYYASGGPSSQSMFRANRTTYQESDGTALFYANCYNTAGLGFFTNGHIRVEGSVLNFTGGHPARTSDILEIGSIVIDDKVILKKNVSNTLTSIKNSTHKNDKRVVGVVSKFDPFSSVDVVLMNAVGEGQVHVCELNGNFEQGDLITTSTMKGKGMKQDDDIVRNYTVGKIRESIDWSDETDEEILTKDGIKYKLAACIYMCG